MPTKVVVTNGAALAAKYGSASAAKVDAALQALVAADAQRGIQTQVVRMDDAAQMSALGGTAVATATDPAQNKAAVDAVATKLAPDFIVIVGAVDVVPYQDVKNPAYTGLLGADTDATAWSDVPYACTAPYSQDARDFLAPTRIVGRLPDLTQAPKEGQMDPAYLVGVLQAASGWSSQPAEDYQGAYFGMSTEVWQASTSANVTAIFGSATDLGLSPPGVSPPGWPAPTVGRRAWFINCHGATVQPKFYGQDDENYPVALLSSDLAGTVTPGTVAAAECCYGAELYAPALRKGAQGIANAFLGNGGWGWFGSTTTAYGPSAPPLSQADLICQYFMREVLAGATQGQAALKAHLDYVAATPVMSPVDLKTAMQFVLLGDPSIQPVQAAAAPAEAPAEAEMAPLPPPGDPVPVPDAAPDAHDVPLSAEHPAWALRVRETADRIENTVSTAAVESMHVQPPETVNAQLRALGERMRRPVRHVASFAVQHAPGGAGDGLELSLQGDEPAQPDRVHLLFSEARQNAEVPDFELIVAHETAGQVTVHQHVYRR